MLIWTGKDYNTDGNCRHESKKSQASFHRGSLRNEASSDIQ